MIHGSHAVVNVHESWESIAGASALLIGPYLLGCGWVYAGGATVAIGLAISAAYTSVPAAIRLVYAECFLVALAAAADVMILGI